LEIKSKPALKRLMKLYDQQDSLKRLKQITWPMPIDKLTQLTLFDMNSDLPTPGANKDQEIKLSQI